MDEIRIKNDLFWWLRKMFSKPPKDGFRYVVFKSRKCKIVPL